MPPVPDPDKRWWPGGGSEPPRVAGPHVHIWRSHVHPRYSYSLEVCVSCRQPNWDQLDEFLRGRMRRVGEEIVRRFQKALDGEDP